MKTVKIITKFFIFITAVLTILYFVSNIQRRNYAFPTEIKTQRGTIYVDGDKEEAVKGILNYINHQTNRESEILVLPEGAMINFLTERKSDNKYYYLIPPNIEIFKEAEIKKELENNLPDYIVIQPMSYSNFHETYFCESFGKEICSLIPKYYEYPKVFGKGFWIAIYKKKAS